MTTRRSILAALLAAPLLPRRASAAAKHWQTLFAGEPWYIQQAAPEQEFTGILQALPAAADGEASIRQRTAYYRLGDRALYTGNARPAALEQLLGKPVVIRGKAIDFPLEGGAVHEIWPGAIRPK
ncbi:MAG: hypothetical protein ACKN9T_08185 [Candidatus Methylumidiphilus sp.]